MKKPDFSRLMKATLLSIVISATLVYAQSNYFHVGNGTNIIYIDPENDLVIVARWIENGKINEFIEKVMASITK